VFRGCSAIRSAPPAPRFQSRKGFIERRRRMGVEVVLDQNDFREGILGLREK
jgi:hypothetical protein